MKYRIIALYKDMIEGSDRWVYDDLTMTIDDKTDGDYLYYKLRQIEQKVVDESYLVDSCFITTDETLYLKKALESSLIVLNSLTKHYEEYLKEKGLSSDEVIEKLREYQINAERLQIKEVGRRCSRCLLRDIEVTDELALMCYDLYEKGLV